MRFRIGHTEFRGHGISNFVIDLTVVIAISSLLFDLVNLKHASSDFASSTASMSFTFWRYTPFSHASGYKFVEGRTDVLQYSIAYTMEDTLKDSTYRTHCNIWAHLLREDQSFEANFEANNKAEPATDITTDVATDVGACCASSTLISSPLLLSNPIFDSVLETVGHSTTAAYSQIGPFDLELEAVALQQQQQSAVALQ